MSVPQDDKTVFWSVVSWRYFPRFKDPYIAPDKTRTYDAVESAERYADELHKDETLDIVRIVETPCTTDDPKFLAFWVTWPLNGGRSVEISECGRRTFDSEKEFEAFVYRVCDLTWSADGLSRTGRFTFSVTPTTFVPRVRVKAARV